MQNGAGPGRGVAAGANRDCGHPQTCQQRAVSYSPLLMAEILLSSLASLFWGKCSPFWGNSSEDSRLAVPPCSIRVPRDRGRESIFCMSPSPGSLGLGSVHLGIRLLRSGGSLGCEGNH